MLKSSLSNIFASNHGGLVAIILLVSLALRWLLIFQGGQYYFSDEQRYETSRNTVNLIVEGHPKQALIHLLTRPEHLGYKIIGLFPATVERLARESLLIPSTFFSIFSVLNLLLICQLSRRVTGHSKEPLYALLIAASSVSLLYFTRHLMPYDTAMTFGLFALHVALTDKPSLKTSLLCGGLSFLCFITYNGYWSLAGLAMITNVLRSDRNLLSLVQKGFFTAIGFVTPVIFLLIVAIRFGENLLTEYRTFATTVSQGSYAEGWSLPFEYFWHTEHLAILALGLLSLYAIIESKGHNKSLNVFTAGLIFVYLCLLIPSVFLHSFVVYGRLARQMMPFLILLSASGLVRLEQNFLLGQKIARFVFVVIFIQAAWNYSTSYQLSYPRQFASKAQAQYPDFDFSEKRLGFGAPTLCKNNGYIIENVKYFVTPPEPNPPVQGELLLSTSHTDNFLPYQYEGYTYEQRQKFRELNLQMRFYKADSAFMSEANSAWTAIKSCVVKEN